MKTPVFLQIAAKDIKRLFSQPFLRLALVSIVTVPMLYSLFYLYAFWNPYGNLNNLPIAIMNQDKGATLNGDDVNYGIQVIDNLQGNQLVQWHFVNEDDLKDGLDNTNYYSLFVIPEDFSQKVVNGATGTPTVATIIYTSNEAKNFLASQITQEVESEFLSIVAQTITNQYSLNAFNGLYSARDGLLQAYNGSDEIYNGLIELNNNLPNLSSGVSQLYGGSKQLTGGLYQVYQFVPKIQTVATSLENTLSNLETSIPTIYADAQNIQNKINSILSNISPTNPDVAKLLADLAIIKNDLTNLNNALTALQNDSDGLVNQTQTLYQTALSSNSDVTNLNQLVNDIYNSYPTTSTIDNIINQINNGETAQAIEALNSIKNNQPSTKYNEYLTSLNTLTSNIQNLSNNLDPNTNGSYGYKVDKLANDAQTISNYVTPLEAAFNQIEQAANQLTGLDANSANIASIISELQALETLANQLKNKIPSQNQLISDIQTINNDLKYASNTVISDITKLYDGSSEITQGLQELNAQIPTLTNGVNQLVNGADQLTIALDDGVKQMSTSLQAPPIDMANFMANPVQMLDAPINQVPNYGTGFTPYFVPLSLWVGAILMFFLIPAKEDEQFNATNIQAVHGKYLAYILLGLLQSLLVGYAVIFLGLRPNSYILYFMSIIIMSFTAISIVQTLITLGGDAGRLIAIVLLLLQLTSDAGTFPLELIPKFFKDINPFMPFTYAVQALREAIAGYNYPDIYRCWGILLIFLFVSQIITIIFKKYGDTLVAQIEKWMAYDE